MATTKAERIQKLVKEVCKETGVEYNSRLLKAVFLEPKLKWHYNRTKVITPQERWAIRRFVGIQPDL